MSVSVDVQLARPLRLWSDLRTRALAAVLRRSASNVAQRSPAELRRKLERMARLSPVPAGIRIEHDELGGRPARWVRPRDASKVLFHLHGGGYVSCSPDTHQLLLADLAAATGRHVLTVDYRKAPEHPFPLPIDDCERAWDALLERGVDPADIVLSGDSAGGGLALALLQRLRDAGRPMPSAVVLLSPWVDLGCRGWSIERYGRFDYLNQRSLDRFANLYLQGADPTNPEASPVHADFAGFPPMLIQVGGAEVLRTQIERLAARASAHGADVTLETWDGMFHAWQGFTPFLPEAREALRSVGRFTR